MKTTNYKLIFVFLFSIALAGCGKAPSLSNAEALKLISNVEAQNVRPVFAHISYTQTPETDSEVAKLIASKHLTGGFAISHPDGTEHTYTVSDGVYVFCAPNVETVTTIRELVVDSQARTARATIETGLAPREPLNSVLLKKLHPISVKMVTGNNRYSSQSWAPSIRTVRFKLYDQGWRIE